VDGEDEGGEAVLIEHRRRNGGDRLGKTRRIGVGQ
jgi:hypothetical protein